MQSIWRSRGDSISRELGLDHSPIIVELSTLKDFVPLARVIKRDDNPFFHENAILELALAAISFIEKNPDKIFLLAPHCLEIKCDDWTRINKAEKNVRRLKLKAAKMSSKDIRYEPPKTWLSGEKDSNKLYRLGAFLRACVTGSIDFTVSQYLMQGDTCHAYFGLKSSWYKRRMGMAHQPEALIGEDAPMSSWISELLYRLLQWPGLEIRAYDGDWPEKFTIASLKQAILSRVEKQADLYGISSDLPIYVESIHHEVKKSLLRIVMAQTLLPKQEDFRSHGPELKKASYRARHAGHVATIARLICDKLVEGKKMDGEGSLKPLADLIVFPELAVHEDDIWIIKRLADKTGAMIFTGLVYRKHGSELINTALWLIPFQNGHGRQWIMRYQGKRNLTVGERSLKIKPWRPYQLVVELKNTLKGQVHGFRLSGSICYDATDISLAADLKNVTNTFLVSALNKDIDTFDTMVDALHYHMYQPVILVNTGQFGGSAAKAPYKEKYEKQIAHVHGNNQIAISMFEMNMYDFSVPETAKNSGKAKKTAPAGLRKWL